MNNTAFEYAKRIINTVFSNKLIDNNILNTVELELAAAYLAGKNENDGKATIDDIQDFGVDTPDYLDIEEEFEPNEFDPIPSTFLMHE